MMVNGYFMVAAFLELVRLGTAAAAIAVGTRALLAWRSGSGEAAWMRLENRAYLSALLVYLLLGLSMASWLVLYLLLDSYVPAHPGAMCIYGVTRIGSGSRGIYGWLPSLVVGTQIMKPVLVLAAGAAVALRRLYCTAGTRALLPRIVAACLLIGVLAGGDGAVESAYLLTPKRNVSLNTGCCSAAAVGQMPSRAPEPAQSRWLSPAYFSSSLLMGLAVWAGSRLRRSGVSRARLMLLLALAAATAVVSTRFLIDVAAPTLMHLPYHHCLYDLVAQVPESVVAIGLLLWATFCVGWACTSALAGRSAGTKGALTLQIGQLQTGALLGYLGAAAMFAVELWLA